MAPTTGERLNPLPNPLPPPPAKEIFTAAQWRTLLAVADTVIPSLTFSTSQTRLPSTAVQTVENAIRLPPEQYDGVAKDLEARLAPDAPATLVHAYLEENASSNPRFREALQRLLGSYMSGDAVRELGGLLWALE